MALIFCGVDNGVTGAISFIGEGIKPVIFQTPVKFGLDFQKSGKHINRIDWDGLVRIFDPYKDHLKHIGIERPLVNPKLFTATISAVRSFESWILFIEQNLNVGYSIIDSRQWQKKYLPAVSGKELKQASLEMAARRYPELRMDPGLKDADAFWIAKHTQEIA